MGPGAAFGVAFFSHQVSGFLGIYLGGLAYRLLRCRVVVGGLFRYPFRVINLPIVEADATRRHDGLRADDSGHDEMDGNQRDRLCFMNSSSVICPASSVIR
jgi:hypothetical protein